MSREAEAVVQMRFLSSTPGHLISSWSVFGTVAMRKDFVLLYNIQGTGKSISKGAVERLVTALRTSRVLKTVPVTLITSRIISALPLVTVL